MKRPPDEHHCHVCGRDACYGLGLPAVPVERWYCPKHVPPGFLPKDRGAG